MRISEDYVYQEIADEVIVVPVGQAAEKNKGIIKLNPSGAFLWRIMSVKNVSKEDLVQELMKEEGIDLLTAQMDVDKYIGQLMSFGCIE